MSLQPSRIYELVTKYTNFYAFPYVYYFRREPSGGVEVSDQPLPGSTRVEAYAARLLDRIVVVQSVDDGDIAYVDVLEERDGTYLSANDFTILDRIYRFLNGEESIGRLTEHARRLISALFMVPVDYVREMEQYTLLADALRNRVVAIIGDNVFVLTKDTLLERYTGEMAKDVARRLSHTVGNPATTLARHLTKWAHGRATVFTLGESSVVCSQAECKAVPLPESIAKLLESEELRVVRIGERASGALTLPEDAIMFRRGSASLLRQVARRKYSVVGVVQAEVSTPVPLVYDRGGFAGYGVPGPENTVDVTSEPPLKLLLDDEEERVVSG